MIHSGISSRACAHSLCLRDRFANHICFYKLTFIFVDCVITGRRWTCIYPDPRTIRSKGHIVSAHCIRKRTTITQRFIRKFFAVLSPYLSSAYINDLSTSSPGQVFKCADELTICHSPSGTDFLNFSGNLSHSLRMFRCAPVQALICQNALNLYFFSVCIPFWPLFH